MTRLVRVTMILKDGSQCAVAIDRQLACEGLKEFLVGGALEVVLSSGEVRRVEGSDVVFVRSHSNPYAIWVMGRWVQYSELPSGRGTSGRDDLDDGVMLDSVVRPEFQGGCGPVDESDAAELAEVVRVNFRERMDLYRRRTGGKRGRVPVRRDVGICRAVVLSQSGEIESVVAEAALLFGGDV